MNESRKVVLQVTASIGFVIGLIAFLIDTRSTGEALETFRLSVLSGVVPIAGAAIALLAVVFIVVLFVWEHRRVPKHL